MNITLPPRLLGELKRRVPPRRRSEFIADAVREKLARAGQAEAAAAAAGSWSDEGRGDAAEEVRRLRDGGAEARTPVSWIAEGPAGEAEDGGG
jgi:hypothetical protein